jgi:hypothetical protein
MMPSSSSFSRARLREGFGCWKAAQAANATAFEMKSMPLIGDRATPHTRHPHAVQKPSVTPGGELVPRTGRDHRRSW